jgi:hypothetical protein
VHSDALRKPSRTPLSAQILEVADEFLLLGIDRDHWLTSPLMGLDSAVDVFELGVPVWMRETFFVLAVSLQAVSCFAKELAHYGIAHIMPYRNQFRR